MTNVSAFVYLNLYVIQYFIKIVIMLLEYFFNLRYLQNHGNCLNVGLPFKIKSILLLFAHSLHTHMRNQIPPNITDSQYSLHTPHSFPLNFVKYIC